MPSNVDLNDIRLFVSVVEAKSISCAAEQLQLPKSYISRHMTALETALEVVLMARSRRGIVLNKTGERFFAQAKAILALSHEAIDGVKSPRVQGVLRVSLPYEIMHGLLACHIKSYCTRFPNVSLELMLENRKVAMIYDGVDIAVRVGMPDVAAAVAKKLCDIDFAVVASTVYLDNHPPIVRPDDLYQHCLLHKVDGVDWRFYPKVSDDKSYHIKGVQKVACNDFLLTKSLACDGLGVALLPTFLLDGKLERVLDDWQIDSVPLYALYHKDHGRQALIKSFVDFLLDILKHSNS